MWYFHSMWKSISYHALITQHPSVTHKWWILPSLWRSLVRERSSMLSKSKEYFLCVLHIVFYTTFFHTMGPDPPSLVILTAKAKLRTALSEMIEWSSGNTTVRLPHWATIYLPGLITKKIHVKGCLTSKSHQPSAPLAPLSSIASKRQPELVQPSAEQDYGPCYWKESKILIQTVVAVQSCTEITCRAFVAWKERSYLAENYTSQIQRVWIFQVRISTKTLGIDWASCQSDIQEVYFVFWITCFFCVALFSFFLFWWGFCVSFLFFFLIKTSEEIVILLEITEIFIKRISGDNSVLYFWVGHQTTTGQSST